MTGLVSQEVVLVDVHHQELAELHVLVPLQGRAMAGPAQPLEMDAQALRQLRRRNRKGGGQERDRGAPDQSQTQGSGSRAASGGPPEQSQTRGSGSRDGPGGPAEQSLDPGVLGAEPDLGGPRAQPDLGVLGAEPDLGGSLSRARPGGPGSRAGSGGLQGQSWPGVRHRLTFPSFNCLTNVVLWCSTFSPFSVPFASI